MDSLSQLAEKAIAVLGDALEEGDAQTKLKAAMYVLKVCGVQEHAKQGKTVTRGELELNMISAAIGEVAQEIIGSRRRITKDSN